MNDRFLYVPAMVFSYGIVAILVGAPILALLDQQQFIDYLYVPAGIGLAWLILALLFRQVWPRQSRWSKTEDREK